MRVKVEFSNDAEEDLDESFLWYELQKPNLGKEFIKCIEDGLIKICNSPHRYPVVYENVRRFIIKKFPFCIYYYISHSKIKVIAVFHNSRNPKIWEKRS